MRFTKMHGCGNDYVYVDCRDQIVSNPAETACFISDRHKGIGSDGLILVCPSASADCRMDMYNADGSQGKMCGNGIRCVGKLVFEKWGLHKNTITVETLSGVKTLEIHADSDGIVRSVTVDMGAPEFFDSPFTDRWAMTCVSMGNPHAVLFVASIKDAPVTTKGREICEAFPDGINVGFVRVKDRENMDYRVWERGSGETLACGTGAAAAFAAARLHGYIENNVTVHLPGGNLSFEQRGDNIFMTGEAVTVFEGEIEL